MTFTFTIGDVIVCGVSFAFGLLAASSALWGYRHELHRCIIQLRVAQDVFIEDNLKDYQSHLQGIDSFGKECYNQGVEDSIGEKP